VETAREVVRQVGSRQTLTPRAARLALSRQRPGQTPRWPAASTLAATTSTAGPPRRRTTTRASASRRPRPSRRTA
jgi:hypothetical protein